MQLLRFGLIWSLVLMLAGVEPVLGSDQQLGPVVSVEELEQALVSQAETRQHEIEEIRTFLRHDSVRAYLGSVGDLQQIEAALPTLDDDTVSYLAARSAAANDELEAGMGTVGAVLIVAGVALAIFLVVWKVQAAGT